MTESADTYAMGAVERMTGLSSHVIRAWERRHGAIRPRRSPGGTRLYTRREIDRLRLLRAAVEAGHPIRTIAARSDDALRALAPEPMAGALAELLAAVERLDAAGLDRLLALQLSARGPGGFARSVALPLLQEVGRRWESGELSIAAEHLTSACVRAALGLALRAQPPAGPSAPRLLFATPTGERHELGALLAAVLAAGCGASVLYLGPDLPAAEVARSARDWRAGVAVLAAVSLPAESARPFFRELRGALPGSTEVWVGGPGAAGLERTGITALHDLGAIEERVRAAAAAPAPAHA